VRWLSHDANRPLPLPDRSFDRVLSALVLEHIADPVPFLRELGRVTRGDGRIVVTAMHPAMFLRGVSARFRDSETGEFLRPRSYVMHLSDYVMSAIRAGLAIVTIAELTPDEGLAARVPRAEKYVGWPMLVVMDLGRTPEARFAGREEILSHREVTAEDIAYVISRIGQFGGDNRAGIERTLHRISALRNRAGKVVGLTLRVGRAVYGTMEIIRDVVEAGRSILLLGRPGVGKTTLLREVARVLADEMGKRVVIVDTSNEIAGDGDIPHPGIGRARRMQVAAPSLQHAVMIEAVENHMPEVVVIDEIGTEQEAAAARTIAERGVQLIATAHGNTLENLMLNPTLSDLVGGVQTVTLGDEEARRRGTQKSVLERKAPPTFQTLVEIQAYQRVALYQDVAQTVDAILLGNPVAPEIRSRDASGELSVSTSKPSRSASEAMERRSTPRIAAN